jgi:predicted hydrocarbon binding protein
MKTGISVIVDCTEDKNHGRQGVTTNTGSYHSTVSFFGCKESATIPNKFLKPCAHVSRPNIESEVLSKAGKEIERVIREVKAMAKATEMHIEHARKYQTDWAKATAKSLEKELQDKREIEAMLSKILHR